MTHPPREITPVNYTQNSIVLSARAVHLKQKHAAWNRSESFALSLISVISLLETASLNLTWLCSCLLHWASRTFNIWQCCTKEAVHTVELLMHHCHCNQRLNCFCLAVDSGPWRPEGTYTSLLFSTPYRHWRWHECTRIKTSSVVLSGISLTLCCFLLTLFFLLYFLWEKQKRFSFTEMDDKVKQPVNQSINHPSSWLGPVGIPFTVTSQGSVPILPLLIKSHKGQLVKTETTKN